MISARVSNATVRIGGGQGVLVPGGFILTAAHCIKWNGEGAMALGDHFIEKITTKSGARFGVMPIAVDPVSDIAVLSALDNQEFGEDVESLEQWCETTKPVPLLTKTPPPWKSISVRVLSHRGNWIKGKVTRYGFATASSGCISIEAVSQIEGGTSGGPIVDSRGRLVGVVSHSTEAKAGDKCTGSIPLACLALPHWLLLRINHESAKRKAKRK